VSMMADFYDDMRGKYPDQETPAALG